MAPLDYGPVLLRKPFGSRLAADTLPSGCPCGQSATVGASPWLCPSFPTSCPCRVRHGRAPQPTRHYPRLWIHRPSSGRPRDLNPPDRDAAQHTLWGLRRRGARARQAILSFPDVVRIEHGLGRPSIPTPGLSHPVSRRTGLPVQRVHASTCGVAARSQHRGGSSNSPTGIGLRGVCPWPCRAGLAGRSPG
jgi:hypothetical protein